MFAQGLPEALSRVRLYKLYCKHTLKPMASVIINPEQIPKIALDHNTLLFHLSTHTQTIQYTNPADAETEFNNIHQALLQNK